MRRSPFCLLSEDMLMERLPGEKVLRRRVITLAIIDVKRPSLRMLNTASSAPTHSIKDGADGFQDLSVWPEWTTSDLPVRKASCRAPADGHSQRHAAEWSMLTTWAHRQYTQGGASARQPFPNQQVHVGYGVADLLQRSAFAYRSLSVRNLVYDRKAGYSEPGTAVFLEPHLPLTKSVTAARIASI